MTYTNSIRDIDEAHNAVQKLYALVFAITGEGFDQFSAMPEDTQGWYLAELAELASTAKMHLEAISEARTAEVCEGH